MLSLNKISLFKRLILLGALLVPNIAFAQSCIGTPPLTQIVVDNTIDICLPTNNANEISALALRQVLQTMTSAIYTAVPQNITSIAANPKTFWYPTYFGITGAASDTVSRLNRLFIGPAVIASSDITAPNNEPTTQSWLDTLFQFGITSTSQFTSLSATGQLALVGAARTSDFNSIFGSASGGSSGVIAIGVGNSNAGGAPIAVGINAIGVATSSGSNGITLGAQMDVNSVITVVPLTPHGGILAGATIGQLITAGAYPTISSTNISIALGIAGGTNSTVFNKGALCFNNSLDATIGLGGNGVCWEMYQGQSIRWLNISDVSVAEMWGNPGGGLILNGELISLGGVVITTAAPTVSTGQIGYGGTTAVSSNCGSLVSAVACVVINVDGTTHYIPYY